MKISIKELEELTRRAIKKYGYGNTGDSALFISRAYKCHLKYKYYHEPTLILDSRLHGNDE